MAGVSRRGSYESFRQDVRVPSCAPTCTRLFFKQVGRSRVYIPFSVKPEVFYLTEAWEDTPIGSRTWSNLYIHRESPFHIAGQQRYWSLPQEYLRLNYLRKQCTILGNENEQYENNIVTVPTNIQFVTMPAINICTS